MKRLLIYISFTLCINQSALCEEYWEDSAVSGDDLVEFLELKINKYSVEFDEPKLVTLHFKSPYQSFEWSLKGPETKVSVLVYEPKDTSKMAVKLTGETSGESKLSFGSYDKETVKFQSIRYRDGFEIVGKESKESEDVLFRLWVSTEAP